MSAPTRRDDPQLVRDLLRLAAGEAADVTRLLRESSAIVDEAQRRRRLEEDPTVRIVRAASAWLPRFALATAILAVAALVWPASSQRRSTTQDEASVVDAWLVTGTVSTNVADPALDAILRPAAR